MDDAIRVWTAGDKHRFRLAKNTFDFVFLQRDFCRLMKPDYYVYYDPTKQTQADLDFIDEIKKWSKANHPELSDDDIHEASINGFLFIKDCVP